MSTFCIIVEYYTHTITNYETGVENGPTRIVLQGEKELKEWLSSFKDIGFIPPHGEIHWHFGAMSELEEKK